MAKRYSFGRFLICLVLSACFSIVGTNVLYAQTGDSAAENQQANVIYGQIIDLYGKSQVLEQAERIEAYREIVSLLDLIEAKYPQSIPGRRLASGQRLGPIDREMLRAMLGGQQTSGGFTVPPDKPKVALAAFSPAWVDIVVEGGKIGAGYAHGQFPSLGANTHAGVDIGGGCGLPVRAPAYGRVSVVVGPGDVDFDSVGNAVIIDHGFISGKRTYTAYFHLRDRPQVVTGPILTGALLGYIGDTGSAEGCHLHFEVRHFEGIRGLFHPVWKNIYGEGDQSNSAQFAEDWSDPVAWLKRMSDPMLSRFSDACRQNDKSGGDLACPFIEEDTCIGEGCLAEGVFLATGVINIHESPGSKNILRSVNSGEYLIGVNARAYSAPCYAPKMKPTDAQLLGNSPVYRLSYAGELVFRYFSDGLIGYGYAEKFVDGRSVSLDGIGDECDGKMEQWFQVETQSGLKGWVGPASELPIVGTTIYSRLPNTPPSWTWPRASLEALAQFSVRTNGKLCKSASVVISPDQIDDYWGSRSSWRSPSGRTGRTWEWSITDTKGEGTVYINGGGYTRTEHWKLPNGEDCSLNTTNSTTSCGTTVAQCYEPYLAETRSKRGPYWVGYGPSGEDVLIMWDLDFDGGVEIAKKRARFAKHPTALPVTAAMLGYPFSAVRKCSLEFNQTCLTNVGLTEEAAKGYVNFTNLLGEPAWVESVKTIGDISVVNVELLQRANSNHQTFVFTGIKLVKIGNFASTNVNKVRDKSARSAFRKYPNSFIDAGRGEFIYLRFRDETTLVYNLYPIVNGCRACEIVGSVTVETEIADGNYQSRFMDWRVGGSSSGSYHTDVDKFGAFARLSGDAKLLQSHLKGIGFYSGSIDGEIRNGSRNALRDFQLEHCLPVTGNLDLKTADALWNRRELWGGCYEN